MNDMIRKRLKLGNDRFKEISSSELRLKTAQDGQHPYAIVICCSDSRVIPEQIFSAEIGDLFVIRVAGNVLDNHQLGSIEYAASHLDCNQIIVLGHTGCGAVAAALSGHSEGYIRFIIEDIQEAIDGEKDPDQACRLNVRHAMSRLEQDFSEHPEISKVEISGAVYDIVSGNVEWI